MSSGSPSPPDPTAELARAAVRARLFDAPSPRIGIGRFALLERVGEGGMGVVFAAHDPELDRKVAIKLLRSPDPQHAQRLLREAKVMARLSHPNVVTVYEAGTTDDGVFLAMEFVPGCDLRSHLAGVRRPWREVVALMIQAARGLAAAHAAGLVHRDFKPENVLVGEDGVAKVADFGLARAVAELRPSASDHGTRTPSDAAIGLQTITRAGAVVGTPMYVAPELFDGAAADARSDQFAFCVALFEAVFGDRPFAGERLHELIDNAQAGRMRLPADRKSVPRRMWRLLVRGLAADPSARHPSMAALADELVGLLDRRRRTTALALGTGMVAVAALATWSVQMRSVRCSGAGAAWAEVWNDDARAAVGAGLAATGHPGADETRERVIAALDGYGDAWIAGHVDACEANLRGEQSDVLLDRRMACLDGRRAHVQTVVEAMTHADLATVERAAAAIAGLPQLARCGDADALERSDPLPDEPAARAEALELRARLQQASALESIGRPEDARNSLTETRARAEASADRSVAARARLGLVAGQPATPEQRDELYEIVYVAEAIGDVDLASKAWVALVTVHPMLKEYDAAERSARHAESLLPRVGTEGISAAAIADARAHLYREKGELDRAVDEGRKAIALAEVAGPDAVSLGTYYTSVGNTLALADDNEGALTAFEVAYELSLTAFGTMHQKTAHALMNLGRMAARQGDYDTSNERYQESLAIMRAIAPSGNMIAALTLLNLGQNYGDQGHYPEAIATSEQAIAEIEALVGPRHRQLVRPHRGLSEIYLDARDLPRAIAEAERALDISIATFGDDHLETSACRRRLGRILVAAGRAADAVPILEQAMADEERKQAPALQRALTRYMLASALQYDAAPAVRERARALARAAAPDLARGEPRDVRLAAEVDDWLAGGDLVLGSRDR